MAATNFHPVQPIVEVVETVGQKTPSLKPAPSARALKTTTKYTRNSQPKESIYQKPQKKPNSEKNQKKTEIRSRGPREKAKARLPRGRLTIPEKAYHRTQPHTKVIVPEPYRPGPRA